MVRNVWGTSVESRGKGEKRCFVATSKTTRATTATVTNNSSFFLLPEANLGVVLALRFVLTMMTFGLAMSLSLAQPRPENGMSISVSISNRRDLLSKIASASMLTAMPMDSANAAIDVSNLRKELIAPTSTDVFLGGAYFVKDEVESAATVEKLGRLKYTIQLEGLGLSLKSSGSRAITVVGRSSTISSRSDYYVELPGKIFPCPTDVDTANSEQHQRQQCISVDFSPTGGLKDTQGYWDVQEQGIRFMSDDTIWAKE